MPNDSIDQSINQMREALLGVAELESGILKNIKSQLDNMLDSVYAHNKELKDVAALDNMIVETPITAADPALVAGLENINSELNEKNLEILKIQRMLEGMGLESPTAGASVEMLRQQLEELNKRNRILREILGNLFNHPIIFGRVPEKISIKGMTVGITVKEVKAMLEKLLDQITALNKTNFDLKQQIKPQNELEKKADTKAQPSTPRRGGPGAN